MAPSTDEETEAEKLSHRPKALQGGVAERLSPELKPDLQPLVNWEVFVNYWLLFASVHAVNTHFALQVCRHRLTGEAQKPACAQK